MPTLNENFGYVFIESLAAGCPLLISDRTVWSDIETKNAGWIMPLENPNSWVTRILSCVDMDDEQYLSMSQSARRYSDEWLANPTLEDDTLKVLEKGLNLSRSTSINQ